MTTIIQVEFRDPRLVRLALSYFRERHNGKGFSTSSLLYILSFVVSGLDLVPG